LSYTRVRPDLPAGTPACNRANHRAVILLQGSRDLDKLTFHQHDLPIRQNQGSRGAASGMAYEYPSAAGVLQIMQVHGRWLVRFAGRRSGGWPSPDQAAKAVARHQSGLAAWDRKLAEAPDDLLDWRPLGDSL
jgi:hypothetical protein